MKIYLWAFVNFESNDWVKLLPIVKFAYNNTKNASIGHISFELNCGYNLWMLYKEKVDSYSLFKLIDKLSVELRELIVICCKNFYHAQKLQKRANDKSVKPRNFASNEKIQLNSKYIKTKQNQKLEAKFFKTFRVLHLIKKQIYNLELPKK